jgi:hypothetical protein
MSETIICGGCNFRVSVKLQHPDDHNCALIADLKKDFNLALSEIQNDYERRIKNLDKKLQGTDHVANCQADLYNILCVKFNKLKEELSTYTDVKLLYSDREAREAWQTGCEVMINTLQRRIDDMDGMLNRSLYSKIKKEGERYMLHTQSYPFEEDQVHVKHMGDIKIHHPSRKHLEGKLREKNELINQHEDHIERLEREFEIKTLKSNRHVLVTENDRLKYKLKYCCCSNQIRQWVEAQKDYSK